jgi:hypothetical protein
MLLIPLDSAEQNSPLVPDGQIQGRWTQKWPRKISCGLGSQRPRKQPNSKFPICGLILTKVGPKICKKNFLLHFFTWFGGWPACGLIFSSSGLIFSAGLAQESWRDLAAVELALPRK